MLTFSEFQVTFSIAIAVSFLEGVSLQYIYIFFFYVEAISRMLTRHLSR